ncbi:MAG: TIGR03960 family B12-binding radical SAM protein [Symbiobacteriaceae bacterium]|nr:TIGR03960 family B12-binding radical SAM protein [Symbiobacteriaceae bacterium]
MSIIYHPLTPEQLASLEKPARYLGNEINSIRKDATTVDVRMALAFPDRYEIGMSHLGSKILYEIVNNLPWAAMERVYAPWGDLEALLLARHLPLCTLESDNPLSAFDLVGFSLQYELLYTNILNMLHLGNIPLYSHQRGGDDPLVIAGGPGAYNPEPLAPFLDIILLGDGEEALPELLTLYRQHKTSSNYTRHNFLLAAASLPGIYVPALYREEYSSEGRLLALQSLYPQAPLPVPRAIVPDMDKVAACLHPLLPYVEIVHDRGMLELFRGCSNGCRFCQAGIIYRPVRERSAELLIQQAAALVASSGYDEISLTSLSSMDYTQLSTLVEELLKLYAPAGVGLALPSLRVDTVSLELLQKIQQVRSSGLTLAPEAGSQRLRDIINKQVTSEDIETAICGAFAAGWSSIKLYFMIGLPGEEESDLVAMVTLAQQIVAWHKKYKPPGRLRLSISVAPFVPKPHTPFQWCGQDPLPVIQSKQQFLRQELRKLKGVEFATHDRETSFLEAVLSRGDRRLADVVLAAWQRGARFDGWSECFKPEVWQESFRACGIDPVSYATKVIPLTDPLPWDHLDSGVSKSWLATEYRKALAGELTPDCRQGVCSGCGVCFSYGISPILANKQT